MTIDRVKNKSNQMFLIFVFVIQKSGTPFTIAGYHFVLLCRYIIHLDTKKTNFSVSLNMAGIERFELPK